MVPDHKQRDMIDVLEFFFVLGIMFILVGLFDNE